MMDRIRRFLVYVLLFPIGWKRVRSGFCPACNSSPPTSECVICRLPDPGDFFKMGNGYKPDRNYHHKATEEKRTKWWTDFKEEALKNGFKFLVRK